MTTENDNGLDEDEGDEPGKPSIIIVSDFV
jgi:hypothetical protein